jgi:hypothetical protein
MRIVSMSKRGVISSFHIKELMVGGRRAIRYVFPLPHLPFLISESGLRTVKVH